MYDNMAIMATLLHEASFSCQCYSLIQLSRADVDEADVMACLGKQTCKTEGVSRAAPNSVNTKCN